MSANPTGRERAAWTRLSAPGEGRSASPNQRETAAPPRTPAATSAPRSDRGTTPEDDKIPGNAPRFRELRRSADDYGVALHISAYRGRATDDHQLTHALPHLQRVVRAELHDLGTPALRRT